VLAFLLRVLWLDLKPPHFDEGVNGWFVDEMTRQGFYRYDPSNFHGPLHFYLLFAAQTLLGRAAWALRLPVVLISTACVALLLAFSRHFDRRACSIAAAVMAVSPAMVFYGRYAIHETELLFFLMLSTWGLITLWREGTRAGLWATGLGITGMILTKETYIIHLVSLGLAYPTLLLLEKVSPSDSALPRTRPADDARPLVCSRGQRRVDHFSSTAAGCWIPRH
jgi:predicted membrane-bound mannosyltransferase